MKVKVSEATGQVLDWMVAKALGASDDTLESYVDGLREAGDGDYSTDWSQGGPIIEREVIELTGPNGRRTAKLYWSRQAPGSDFKGYHAQTAETDLVAAMRCFVMSRLGDEVEVPEELLT